MAELVDALDLGSSTEMCESLLPYNFYSIMKELSEIIQELVENSNSMNQIDSKTAIQYVVEAYEAGMDKAKELIKDSGEL